MRNALVIAAAAGAASLAWMSTASAESLPTCQSQSSLEQVIESNGKLQPDDCSTLTVTKIDTDNGELCVIDFAGAGDGVLNALRDAALPQKWWVRCNPLGEAADGAMPADTD